MTVEPPHRPVTDPEIRDFHVTSPHLQDDPHPFYARLRRDFPVARSDRFGGYWILSTYDEINRAYHSAETFSSCPNAIPSLGQQRPVIPVEIDPPEHAHYRQILNPLFTARAVQPWEPRIRRLVEELVADVAPRGSCDYVQEFAKVVPTRVFLAMTGLSQEDGPMLTDWTEQLLNASVDGDEEATRSVREQTGLRLYGYLNAELDRRDERGRPVEAEGLDFIDSLRAASYTRSRPLSRMELLDILFIVLIGGLDTTQSVLSSIMEHLATHEEMRRELIADPALLDTAVEEFLRYFSPVTSGRRLTRDIEVGGVPMRAEDRVMMLTASACRDESRFPDPDTLDLRRSPNPHLAFGAGIHRCLGVRMARLELRHSLREWHRRIPDYRITPGAPIRRHVATVAGIDELRLEWD